MFQGSRIRRLSVWSLIVLVATSILLVVGWIAVRSRRPPESLSRPEERTMFTTPPPILDVLKDFPELAPLAKTTVRLHPRLAADGSVDSSKLGGTFLWPLDEPWPAYDEAKVARWLFQPSPTEQYITEMELKNGKRADQVGPIPPGTSIPFAPILQLRAADFPEMPFPQGTDLFQLLWFPYCVEVPPRADPDGRLHHRVYWRNSRQVSKRRTANPPMVERHSGWFARPSRFHPERVVEYPNSQDLDPKLERRIDRWKAVRKIEHAGDTPIDFYDWECSVCPSTKVGGYVCWQQDKEVPICSCKREMTHLLTVADGEWGGGTERRWLPVEERAKGLGFGRDQKPGDPHEFGSGATGTFHLFVCTQCDGWPTKAVSRAR
jgi:hypothetical protein